MVKLASETIVSVLQHVYRYGLTLPPILRGSGVLGEVDEEHCQNVILGLVESGLLAAHELYVGHPEEPYFYLTDAAVRLIGVSEKAAGPIPRKTRAKCFAVAAFCTLRKTKRTKLTREEFRSEFKELWYPGQPTDYYTEALDDQRYRLGYFRVDFGGTGGWDHIIDSCRDFAAKRCSIKRVRNSKYHSHVRAWRKRVDQGLFRIAILTSQPHKASRLSETVQLRRLRGEDLPEFRIYFVPGLFDVLKPRPGAR